MKKINAIVCGVASIFSSASVVDTSNIFKEYPTTHRKNVKEALQNSWITVGTAVKGAIDKYAEEVKMTTNRRNDNGMREILLQKQEQYSGIIPHPSIVEGYERNCPGATDRILAMTENQLKCNQELAKMEQENINECRKEALKSEVENIKRGQILGFVILLTMIIGGFILIIFGKDAGGYGTIVASIMLGISSVIWNNKSKKEQEEKQ